MKFLLVVNKGVCLFIKATSQKPIITLLYRVWSYYSVAVGRIREPGVEEGGFPFLEPTY